MAFSATYSEALLADLEPLMKRPQRVMLCPESVSLAGVRQFYVEVPAAAAAAAGGPGCCDLNSTGRDGIFMC
eukprot:356209-Chlamydomonas_euryale.AAC.2